VFWSHPRFYNGDINISLVLVAETWDRPPWRKPGQARDRKSAHVDVVVKSEKEGATLLVVVL